MLCQLTRSLECSNILRKNKKKFAPKLFKKFGKNFRDGLALIQKNFVFFFCSHCFFEFAAFFEKTIDEKKKNLKSIGNDFFSFYCLKFLEPFRFCFVFQVP